MRLLRAAYSSFVLQLKLRVVYPVSYLQVVVQPAILGSIALLLLPSRGQVSRLPLAILGGGLVGLWSMTLYNSIVDIVVERWTGTLELLVACPTPLPVIIVGKIASSLLLGMVSFVLMFGLAYLWFHPVLPTPRPLELVVSFLLTVTSFFAVGMVLAPLFAWSKAASAIANAMEIPMYLLCGFMFPVTQLPGWVQPITWLLPPQWGVRALVSSVQRGTPDSGLWLSWTLDVILIAIYLSVALVLFRLVAVKARVTGELASV